MVTGGRYRGSVYSKHFHQIVDDRVRALADAGPDGIAALFERVPMLAELAGGHGPLAPYRRRGIHNSRELGEFLASQIPFFLAHADRIQTQLLGLAAYHGGLLTRERAIAESGVPEQRLDQAAADLAALFLVDPDVDLIGLREGVMSWLPLPGMTFRMWAEDVPKRELEPLAHRLHVDPGTRKWERVDAIEAALRDPKTIATAAASLDREARELLELLARRGVLEDEDLYGKDWSRYRQVMLLRKQLMATGLVAADHQGIWLWLDVVVTLNGALYHDWNEPELVISPPVTHQLAPSIPPVVSQTDRVLSHLGANPAPTLKAGGFGTTAVRAVAKALGMKGPAVGLVVALAIELGLLGTSLVEASGRGRNRREERVWMPSATAAQWQAQPAALRWQQLVDRWRLSQRVDLGDKPVERWDPKFQSEPAISRNLFLRWLEQIPEGSAVAEQGAVDVLAFRYPSLVPAPIGHQLVAEARILGLVDTGDPFAPSQLLRAMLRGEDIEALLGGGSTSFIVQADHTVIAPPDLDADIVSKLGHVATLESSAGAHTYRIDQRSLTPALDSGMDGEDIVEFLTTHSSVPVPDVVLRTVADAADHHGRLQIGSAKTWLSCDDPAVISRAVGVKAAKLRVVSPTAAVSDLPQNKVMTALRAAGLVPVDTATEDAGPPITRGRDGGSWTVDPLTIDPAGSAERIWHATAPSDPHPFSDLETLEAIWELDIDDDFA